VVVQELQEDRIVVADPHFVEVLVFEIDEELPSIGLGDPLSGTDIKNFADLQ